MLITHKANCEGCGKPIVASYYTASNDNPKEILCFACRKRPKCSKCGKPFKNNVRHIIDIENPRLCYVCGNCYSQHNEKKPDVNKEEKTPFGGVRRQLADGRLHVAK